MPRIVTKTKQFTIPQPIRDAFMAAYEPAERGGVWERALRLLLFGRLDGPTLADAEALRYYQGLPDAEIHAAVQRRHDACSYFYKHYKAGPQAKLRLDVRPVWLTKVEDIAPLWVHMAIHPWPTTYTRAALTAWVDALEDAGPFAGLIPAEDMRAVEATGSELEALPCAVEGVGIG